MAYGLKACSCHPLMVENSLFEWNYKFVRSNEQQFYPICMKKNKGKMDLAVWTLQHFN